MSSQAERAQTLTRAAEDLSRRAKLVRKFNKLSTRAKHLENLRVDVVELGEAYSRLVKLEVTPEVDLDTTARIRALTDDLCAGIENELSSIVEDDQLKKRYLEPLRRYCDAWRKELLSTWSAWIEEHVALQPDALLAVLRNIPSWQEQVTQVTKMQQEIREISSALPGAKSVPRIQSLSAALTKARSTVGTSELPPSVEAFLVKLGQRQAHLSDIDTAVRQWLEAEGLLDDFAVVAG